MARLTRFLRAALCVATTCGLFALPAHAQQPASLNGQALLSNGTIAGHTSTFTGTCNPRGNSTFRFKVSGSASGPFNGSFTESGTFTIGPLLPMPDGNLVATPLAFHSIFAIRAAEGTVFGVKTLSEVPLEPFNFGTCGEAAFFGFLHGVAIQLRADYFAVLKRGHEVSVDRGKSFVDYGDIGARPDTGIGPFQFFESFTSERTARIHDRHPDCCWNSEG